MKTHEQIIEWLKGQKLEHKFAANYNRGVQHRMSLENYMKNVSPEGFFLCAFVWHDTREGNRYWFNINNNFLKWLNNENIHQPAHNRARH